MIRKEEVYKIGMFNKPHGIHGELSFTFTNDSFDDSECDYLICSIDGIFVPFFIEEYRFRTDTTALVKLKGIDSSDKARSFTNTDVYFPVEFVLEKAPAELGWDFFVGFAVKDVKQGEVGRIVEVDNSTINTLFVIDNNGEEVLVPAHEEFILKIDKKKRVITVQLPEGLLNFEEAEDGDDE